jgi:hypothetical protein
MGLKAVDKGDEFIQDGMTLITEIESDKYLNLSKKRKKKVSYSIPEDRYSRPCGGAAGFDDYAEWL